MIKSKYYAIRTDPGSTLEFLCDMYDALEKVDPKNDLLKYVDVIAPGRIEFSKKYLPEFTRIFSKGAKELQLKEEQREFLAMVHYGRKMHSRICELLDIDSLVKDLVVDFE